MNKIFINKNTWNTFNETKLKEYINLVFNYYRINGFPYFNLTQEDINKEFNNLLNFNTNSILLEDDKLKQVMLGLNLVNFFMPHMWNIKTNKFKSPMEAFLDDKLFLKAIEKRIKLGDNISDAGIRKALSWVSGTHRVSNFKPTIAKWIYDNFSGEGKILDFSCGYGGRLFGALTSDKVKCYIGTDPCLETFNCLNKMNNLLNNKEVKLYNIPFEDLNIEDDFDLSFSSPPYFNTEEYSYEDTQSFIRYKTKNEWKEGFLEPLINKNFKLLKNNGNFIINIANVSTYKNLEEDTLDISNKIGFKLIKTYKMSLSALMSKGFKYEPIFHFKKFV